MERGPAHDGGTSPEVRRNHGLVGRRYCSGIKVEVDDSELARQGRSRCPSSQPPFSEVKVHLRGGNALYPQSPRATRSAGALGTGLTLSLRGDAAAGDPSGTSDDDALREHARGREECSPEENMSRNQEGLDGLRTSGDKSGIEWNEARAKGREPPCACLSCQEAGRDLRSSR